MSAKSRKMFSERRLVKETMFIDAIDFLVTKIEMVSAKYLMVLTTMQNVQYAQSIFLCDVEDEQQQEFFSLDTSSAVIVRKEVTNWSPVDCLQLLF